MANTITRDQAANRLHKTIQQADSSIRRIRQEAHRERWNQSVTSERVGEARRNGLAGINQARADLDAAITAEKREAQREPATHLSGEWAARRTYYATRGMALAQAGPRELTAEVKAALTAGNRVAASEYLAAGGSELRDQLGSEYPTITKAVAGANAATRAATVEGLDVYQAQTHRLDTWIRNNMDRIGQAGDPGNPDAQPQDLSEYVSRWHQTAEQQAAEAGAKSAEGYRAAADAYGLDD